jgi:hypothetical protein
VTHEQHELAYAAGIIDGEGWIGMSVYVPPPDSRKQKSTVFQCVVCVGMKEPEVVIWLQEKFGGNVHSYEPGRYNSSGVHQWRLTAGQAAEFCRQVRPYLKMKHRQAQLLVEYREDPRLDHTRHGGHGVRTPEAEVAVKHEYKTAFGVLNKRGVPAGR